MKTYGGVEVEILALLTSALDVEVWSFTPANGLESGARCWCRSWLRHCATNRQVTGSIPDGVTGIFH